MTWTIEINKIFKSRNVSNVNVSSGSSTETFQKKIFQKILKRQL